MHVPATQACPSAQAGPAPHLHVPPVQLLAVTALQAVHAAPPVPHAARDGVVHTVPAQQPAGPHVPPQARGPPTQGCPAPHAGPAPHVHAPAVQPSAVEPHAVHAPPAVPQAAAEGVVHVLPAQQPVGHDVPSQTHAPPRQCCPALQGGPVPHLQLPPVQLSAVTALQAVHAAPPVPHAARDGVVHTVPAQQPAGHDVASQTQVPPTQCCPVAHAVPAPRVPPPAAQPPAAAPLAVHAPPAVPQA